MRRKLPVGPPNSGMPPVRQRSAERAVLRTVVAVHPRRVVARRLLGKSRRARRIVGPAVAGRLLVLAGLGRLQQGEPKRPVGGDDLLGLRGERRQPAVGRIDDQRRARAGVLEGDEYVVVGAGDVALGAALRAPLAAEHFGPHPSSSARSASVKNSWSAYLAGRCSGVAVSSVQMPWRSGSPQGVFSAGGGPLRNPPEFAPTPVAMPKWPGCLRWWQWP